MNKKEEYINELLYDERFLNYILTGNKYARKHWSEYRNSEPEKNEAYLEAERLIKSVKSLEAAFMHGEVDVIRDRISDRLKEDLPDNSEKTGKPVIKNLFLKIAAVLLLPLLVFGFFKIYMSTVTVSENISTGEMLTQSSDEVKIITADGENILPDQMNVNDTYSTSEASISKTGTSTLKYSAAGDDPEKKKKIAYNTVIVPRGKRYNIELPDGTTVWLNSDTEFMFPVRFRKDEPRHVKLRGEAYFEVTNDISSRFIVGTQGLNVIVYGTSFNVSAYSDIDISETTLVEGAVGIEVISEENGRVYRLEPSENAEVRRKDGLVEIKKVDTREYTSWKDGYLIFRDEEMNILGPKIERWYDIQLVYRTPDIESMRFSGTISEEKSLEHILGLIEKACNLSYQKKDDKVFLYKEEKIMNYK